MSVGRDLKEATFLFRVLESVARFYGDANCSSLTMLNSSGGSGPVAFFQ